MNCQNLTLREIQILRRIGRRKRKSVSVKKIMKQYDETAISTILHLAKKHLVSSDDSKENVSITVGGIETLKDYQLHRRNIWIDHFIKATIATVSTLFGVIVGYLLSFI